MARCGRRVPGGLLIAAACLACASSPRHPPAAGPVGASGTCWAAVPSEPRAARATPSDEASADAGATYEYGYHFDEDDGPRVGFAIERGELRELVVTPTAPLGPGDAVFRIGEGMTSTAHRVRDAEVARGRAADLHVPLVVGQWTEVVVALPAGPLRVRLRVVGDGAEVQLPAGTLPASCVWGRVDRDSL